MSMPPIPDESEGGVSLSKFMEDRDLDREFRVPASDHRGHNERLQLKVPGAMLRQLGMIVKHSGLPYRWDAEVVRHALMRHFKWLEGISPVPSITGQLLAVM